MIFDMKKFIFHLILLAVIVYFGLPYVIDGIAIDPGRTGIIAAVLFAFINITVKPIINIITLPLNILSLGLFGFIVNVLLFWVVASVIDGIAVVDIVSALWGSLVMIVANWIIEKILR